MNVAARREVSWDRLKEDAKRAVLLRLRDALEKGALAVPGRFSRLVEELLDYSYRNASSGYVHALALAVSLAFS